MINDNNYHKNKLRKIQKEKEIFHLCSFSFRLNFIF